MEIVYQRCAGLDIRKKSVTACLLIADKDDQVRKEIRTYSPKTPDISTCEIALKKTLPQLDGSQLDMLDS